MKLHVLELPLQRNISMYQKIVKDEIDRLNDDHDGSASDVDDSRKQDNNKKKFLSLRRVKQ